MDATLALVIVLLAGSLSDPLGTRRDERRVVRLRSSGSIGLAARQVDLQAICRAPAQ